MNFHPAIALAPKRGLEFSTLLSERVDVTKVDLGSGTWVFSLPLPETPKGQFQIAVTAQQIQISATFPATTTPPEWIETRQMEVLRRFESFFRPTLILGSAAMIRAIEAPMPRPAPVMIATRPSNLPIASSSFSC
ncbi:MAG: hypothetical protein IID38_12020 [Planctomycetes bacterium]|nr:hypothetical protein [Planctomycetota bacterium]